MTHPMPAFEPCGVVTITTDFGHRGPFVGTMKGVMLSRQPELQIVDLTHEVHVHWPAEAGFWLERAYSYFPRGTVHLAVVDPGVGTSRDVLLVVGDGHVFLAPDNGLLASVITRIGGTAIGPPVLPLASSGFSCASRRAVAFGSSSDSAADASSRVTTAAQLARSDLPLTLDMMSIGW